METKNMLTSRPEEKLNRSQRRKLASAKGKELMRREEKAAKKEWKTTKEAVELICNPERYLDFTSKIHAAYMLCFALDDLFNDAIEIYGESKDIALNNHLKQAKQALDYVLNRLLKDMRNDKMFDTTASCGYDFGRLAYLIVLYFLTDEDKWRLTKLNEFLRNIITQDAHDDKVAQTEEYLRSRNPEAWAAVDEARKRKEGDEKS